MFPYPIATPQKCDIQTFYGSSTNVALQRFSWNKPVGVSHVYMLLIGAGGTGNGTNGGGSGAVTVWYGAAQHVPNNLIVEPGIGDASANTTIYFRSRSTNAVILIDALSATGDTAGTASTAGPFAASGFYKSTDGQNGVAGGAQSPDGATFLSGGGSGSATVSNYGYQGSAVGGTRGYFQMQPIIVGVGATGANRGAIGCGGGVSGTGGPGMVLIASW